MYSLQPFDGALTDRLSEGRNQSHSDTRKGEGIGTLTMPVVAEEAAPGGTGARLPPVSSYRR